MVTTFQKQPKGFTLLELLIVIAVLAILSVALILVLNPAETLRKSRDAQRITDLSTLKTAIGLYVTNVNTPNLSKNNATGCLAASNTSAKIFYSAEVAGTTVCAGTVATGGDAATGSGFLATGFCTYAGTSGVSVVDGSGWIPVDFTTIPGGSPISNLPVDPTNTVATATAPASTDLVYRYACQGTTGDTKPSTVFEINAQLESSAYTSTTDDRRKKDGGDNDNYYEVGTNLKLIGTGTNF